MKGIVGVLQTPFDDDGGVDYGSLDRLVEDAAGAGVHGFLAPVVASEVAYLSGDEREQLVRHVAAATRVPLIVGASSDDTATCRRGARLAESVGAAAYLVAVPDALYATPQRVRPFLEEVASATRLPMILQDFQFNGPGLPVPLIRELSDALPTLIGIKIETGLKA